MAGITPPALPLPSPRRNNRTPLPSASPTSHHPEKPEPLTPSNYEVVYFTTKISSITVQVTALIEACALGQPSAADDELRRIESQFGREALAKELAATDDWAGSTPLHWSAFSDSGEVMALLIEADADVSLTNKLDGSTALHLAGRYGSTACASTLIAAGADVGVRNNLGNTPLHECCSPARAVLRGAGAQMRVARGLIAARAPVDIHNRAPFTMENGEKVLKGVTPLLIASEVGSVEMIRLLLQSGADPFTKSTFTSPTAASRPDSGGNKGVQFATIKLPASVEIALKKTASTGKEETQTTAAPNDSAEVAVVPQTSSPSKTQPSKKGEKGENLQTRKMVSKSPTWRSITFRARNAMPPRGSVHAARVGHTPVQLALRAGHLMALAEILLGMWRRGGKPHSHEDVELLDAQEVMEAVLNMWTTKEPLRRDATATVNALTLITLSLKHGPTRGGNNLFSVKTNEPRNPVLFALKLSIHCRNEASRLERGGRRQLAVRVNVLTALFQLVARGLLDGAQVGTDEAKAPYSRWNVRKATSSSQGVQPSVARGVWLKQGTTYAAANQCHIFLADSLVYTHVRSVFLPRISPEGGPLRTITFVMLNIAWLPALVFMPQHIVISRIRKQNVFRSESGSDWIVWLYPYGGATLRFTSAVALGVLLTLRIAPEDGQVSGADCFLLLWTAAIATSICEEIQYQRWQDWTADVFNVLELVILGFLLGIDGCIIRDLVASEQSADATQLSSSLQAFATLLAWMRVLRVCYYFPNAGPQLLTILYLIGDLAALLPLILFVLLAFSCGFSVLTYGANERDDVFFVFFINMMQQLVGLTLNGEPQQVETDFPGPKYGTNTGAKLSIFLLMTSFGLLVVVLMLSLIVAKFAKSVEYVAKSIDVVYKLKFAQVTYASFLQLQTSALVPQPLNVLRRATLILYGLVGLVIYALPGNIWLKKISARVDPRDSRDSQVSRDSQSNVCGNEDGMPWTETTAMSLSKFLRFSSPTDLSAQESGLEVGQEVARFIEAAISEVKLFPESVEEYCQRNEHELIDGEVEIDLISRVSDSRRVQDAHAKTLITNQERQEEEIKRQTQLSQMASDQLSRFEDRLLNVEGFLMGTGGKRGGKRLSLGDRRRCSASTRYRQGADSCAAQNNVSNRQVDDDNQSAACPAVAAT